MATCQKGGNTNHKKHQALNRNPLRKKPIDLWLAIGGVVVAIVLTLVPKTPFVVIGSLILIFLLMLHPLWNFWWIEKTLFRRLVTCFLLLIILFFLGNASWPPEAKSPDVSLRFIYSKNPNLVIVNQSDSIARDMKWMLAIWNMDLPDRNDPLPIPISTFDWLKPHTVSGPLGLFSNSLVSPLLKPGDHLFGSASISCPNCSRGRTYIVYIIYGKSGWYSEVEGEGSGNLIIPKNFLRNTRETYFRELEAQVPQKNRIPIVDR